MTTPDARAQVAQAIENAMAHLDEALFQLDRVPAFDTSAIGFVAHATNSYLAVNEATLDLLSDALRDHANPEIPKWLDGLRHLAMLVHHTVGRLVRVTRPSDFPLQPDDVNLLLLMQRAADYYRKNAEEQHSKIVVRSAGDVPPAWADRVAVAVVADNLLSNALKFSEPGGTIHVQIAAGPGGVVCSIRDHDPRLLRFDQTRHDLGMPPAAPMPARDSSTGFEIAIAQEFIDRMGGRLWFESEPGQGTCFSFRLPYHSPDTSSAR